MQQWEYCLLVAMPNNNALVRYQPTGPVFKRVQPAVRVEEVDDPMPEITVEVSRVLADLGREGWELVNANSIVVPGYGASTEFFFKRPLQVQP